MIWRTNRREFDLAQRGLIMGVVNVTPDSFSDGGHYLDTQTAVDHAMHLTDEGADLLDIGGESTRPGAAPVSADEEMRRVLPVIKALAERTSAALSIDTSKAAVARAAIEAGAEIINDVTALCGDESMAEVAASTGAAVVLMHLRGTPQTMQIDPRYDNTTAEVAAHLYERLAAARTAGIREDRLAIDPGIGFGKSVDHNLQLIANLGEFAAPGRPVLLGVSRKSFLATAAGAPDLADREAPTIALTALGFHFGARIFRVHDVRPNVKALRLAESLLAVSNQTPTQSR